MQPRNTIAQTSVRTDAPAAASPPAPRLGRIEALLVERGVVTIEQLAAAKDRQRGAKRPLVEVLLEQEAVDEDRLVATLAEALGVAVVPLSGLQPDPAVQKLVPPDLAQRLGLLPLRVEGDLLVVATGDPLQLVAFDDLSLRTGLRVQPVLAKPSDVRAAMGLARSGEDALHDLLKNSGGIDPDIQLAASRDESATGAKSVDVAVDGTDGPTVRLVNLLVSDAIRQGASDVHIEAEKDALRVRFRIDGDLREVLTVPPGVHASTVSRIKIIAGLDIMETRRPQDGRVKVTLDGKGYDLRVSTIPSYFGEKVVMRVLDPSAATFDLDRCGIEEDVLARWRELIHRPNGLLLLTGPTGSGKTSTLYASILEVRDPSLNVVTVEDPVEYQFPGIVHVPVRTDIGMTFAAALRSILRQDPDVVLLGEIRDSETAKVAMQAAMTGHLVVSTLHTNDAVGAIARLVELGVEPQVVAASLLGVMSQRLARTICTACAAPHVYDASELRTLGWAGTEPATGTRRGAGCPKCRGTGVKGRTALVELVVVTPELSELVARRAPDAELRAQTQRDGTRPLVELALRRTIAGMCTPADVRAVAALDVHGAGGPRATPLETMIPVPVPAAPSLATVAAPARAPSPATASAPPCRLCAFECVAGWRYCPNCGQILPVAPAGPTVLICDDDPGSRRIASLALRDVFPRIVQASDGREALDLIALERPDLLIVDQVMPGLTGIDVIRALRGRLETATLPILMVTATDDESMETVSLDAGADDYLQKPISPQRLRTRAKALLASRMRTAGTIAATGQAPADAAAK